MPLEQMVSPVAIASLGICHHEVSESLNMARCLQDHFWGDSWTFNLQALAR